MTTNAFSYEMSHMETKGPFVCMESNSKELMVKMDSDKGL